MFPEFSTTTQLSDLNFSLTESTLDALVDSPDDATDGNTNRFGLRTVLYEGINNLTGEAMASSGITVQRLGTITVHASKKSFSGPASLSYDVPDFMPPDGFHSKPVPKWDGSDEPIMNRRYRIALEDGRIVEGRTNLAGFTQLVDMPNFQHVSVELLDDD
ncbi:hypothetical protein [Nitrogeniibacter aestuarii]|uniref:hypothetical protein n=1 Tax=Nitrogeniibacter aestuarii TaxID=2815343 RepID=UPI001D10CB0E|nr:hypothetical protein [Nitrogeniibacter aestuarii]